MKLKIKHKKIKNKLYITIFNFLFILNLIESSDCHLIVFTTSSPCPKFYLNKKTKSHLFTISKSAALSKISPDFDIPFQT